MSRSWLAPAKLNLFLAITGRRHDGYHDLQTVFQLIGLYDRLRFEEIAEDRIERVGGLAGLPAEEDLAVRAAWLLKRRFGVRAGVRIHIDKRIPAGGGLGAVAVMRRRSWSRSIVCGGWVCRRTRSPASDSSSAAMCRFSFTDETPGRKGGEILHPLRLPRRWFVVIDPGQRVDTREAFAAPELTRNAPRRTIRRFLRDGLGGNAFEAVVRVRHPEVAAALAWLRRFGAAGLSGSGDASSYRSRTAVRRWRWRGAVHRRGSRTWPAAYPAHRCCGGFRRRSADTGASPSGKAPDFDSGMRRFESCRPSQSEVDHGRPL